MTIRWKLTALVLGSMVPALVAAALNGVGARERLLAQAGDVIEGTADSFERIVDDSLKGRRAPLVMASENAYLARILKAGDHEAVERYLLPLEKAYRKRVVMIADAAGQVIAAGHPEIGPVSLGPEGSEAFGALLKGEDVEGMVLVNTPAGPSHALISALPILDAEGAQVGAIAVLSPVTDGYLSYLGRRVQAALALSVNGTLVAASKDHEAPQLEAHGSHADFEERGAQLWALKTFEPKALQREGQVATLTAAQDVTALRTASEQALWRELGLLAGLSLVVLVAALWVSRRIATAVRGISDAAREVGQGHYVKAPVLHTGDELESLTEHFNTMVAGLEERDRLKETFGRYVTRQVADHLMQGSQELGGEMVPVTVLFSDIRSFTSISERMEPRALLDFLNEYFTGMVESVLRHHGVVDKFIGDAIMAVFGAPSPEAEDPLRAVRAALEMRERLTRINEGFKARGLPEIRTGIGLHSGLVVAGNMGHSERMEYTVIGDTVNLASRLEGMTKELDCDIVVSEDLYLQVAAHVEAEPLRKIRVKGREREVMVYRLVALKPESQVETRSSTAAL